MKEGAWSGKKVLWMILVCIGIQIFCMGAIPAAAANVITQEEIVDFTVLNDTAGAALPEAPSVSLFSARSLSSGWSYGSQLGETEMEMYQALAAVTDMTQYYYSSTGNKGIVVELTNPYVCPGNKDTYKSSAEYLQAKNEWNRATHAYLRDDGRQYWISHFAVGVVTSYIEGSGSVSITKISFYPVDYYSDIRSELEITEAALNTAIREVASVEGTYNKVKAAHDYVINLITYNSSDLEAKYGHTITGGLLDKYNHLGVCEAYAKLFRLLCEENGIPCILITGGSGKDANGNIIANHMWNYVQMDDGNWYLVDTTWDDMSDGIAADYFLAGAATLLSNGKLVGEDHLPVGCFSADVNYDPFILPAIATKAYDAAEDDTTEETPVTGIVLDQTAITVEVGKTAALKIAEYEPAEATVGTDAAYTSSDSLTAAVDGLGTVTAVRPGTATITVASIIYPTVKATCEVTVIDHKYENGDITREATCKETGLMTYICMNAGCEETKEDTIPLAEHIPGEWEVTKAATCTETGEKVQKCTKCGEEVEIETTDIIDHSYGTWSTKTAATCTEAEVQTRTCAECGETETQTVGSVNGHTPGEWETTKAATGSKKGKKVQKCTECDTVLKTETIPKTYVKLNVTGTVKMQKKQTTSAVKISSFTSGDKVSKWVSSKPTVVSVNKKTGKLTAKKTGTAKITVYMKSGAKASVKVKVQKGAVQTNKLTVSKKSVKLKKKETYTIKTTRSPITTTDKLKFSSSDKKVATVNASGKITAKKKGKTTITVKSGRKSVMITVTVK